jgi:hypothetical protein
VGEGIDPFKDNEGDFFFRLKIPIVATNRVVEEDKTDVWVATRIVELLVCVGVREVDKSIVGVGDDDDDQIPSVMSCILKVTTA